MPCPASIAALENGLAKEPEAASGIGKFIGIARKHIGVEELNTSMLRELVEKIVVHEKVRTESVDTKGRKRKPAHQQIDIYIF